MQVISKCHPLEHFGRYLQFGYYPFYFEQKQEYYDKLENTINYIIDVELTKYRSLDVGYTRQVKALLHVISQMVPYEVDIAKLSKASGISRLSTLKYLTHLDEARLIRRLFTDLKNVTDLQKPDKMYLDNTNLLYTLSQETPEIGTVRETFFANQLRYGSTVEAAVAGDFIVDGRYTFEVGGAGKTMQQIAGVEDAYIAADDIEYGTSNRIPLWMFGLLY